jgi:lambda repressor-like predicted transcriptional regulator
VNLTIGGTTSLDLTATQQARRPQEKGPYEAVSGVLGMSADDIASAVSSGTSLSKLADAKGVSQDDLLAALKDGAPEDLKSDADIDQIVSQIAQQVGAAMGKGGPGGPGGHGGPPPGPPPGGAAPTGAMTGNLTSTQDSTLQTLSDLLDMSSDEVSSALQNGESLTDLLSDKGVGLDDLASALQSSMTGSTTGFQIDARL